MKYLYEIRRLCSMILVILGYAVVTDILHMARGEESVRVFVLMLNCS